MDNFDLKKYLVENKLTRSSQIKENIGKSPEVIANKLLNKFNGDFKKIDKYIDDKLLKNQNKSNTPIDKVDMVDKFWKEVYQLILKNI